MAQPTVPKAERLPYRVGFHLPIKNAPSRNLAFFLDEQDALAWAEGKAQAMLASSPSYVGGERLTVATFTAHERTWFAVQGAEYDPERRRGVHLGAYFVEPVRAT